jgi:hypothetical protein
MSFTVSIQTQDFDLSQEVKQLRAGDARVGAVATFVGTVRDRNDGSDVAAMTLEHYPGMTEKSLEEIIEKANWKSDHDYKRIVKEWSNLDEDTFVQLARFINAKVSILMHDYEEAWLDRDGKIDRQRATELVMNLIWRGISGFPKSQS